MVRSAAAVLYLELLPSFSRSFEQISIRSYHTTTTPFISYDLLRRSLPDLLSTYTWFSTIVSPYLCRISYHLK